MKLSAKRASVTRDPPYLPFSPSERTRRGDCFRFSREAVLAFAGFASNVALRTHGSCRLSTENQNSAGSVYMLRKKKLNAVFSKSLIFSFFG